MNLQGAIARLHLVVMVLNWGCSKRDCFLSSGEPARADAPAAAGSSFETLIKKFSVSHTRACPLRKLNFR